MINVTAFFHIKYDRNGIRREADEQTITGCFNQYIRGKTIDHENN